MNKRLISFIREMYGTEASIPLHVPTLTDRERTYVVDAIDSTFVSSVGRYVDEFECEIEKFTGTEKAIATVNGTAALHAALHLAGVEAGDLVITQALTFVATCNALHHMGAEPVLVDVSAVSLGLCPRALEDYLEIYGMVDLEGTCVHKTNGRRIQAVVPMHTFGHPAEMEELLAVCERWNLQLVEDAAESLGSFYKGRHTGTFGRFGALSFNGNKVITTGGGGMIMCREKQEGLRAKHLTTTAKVPHPYEFYHDEAGFNYRLPNLNAALGCAQMEALPALLRMKRQLAESYRQFFASSDYRFVVEPPYARSNYWLNSVMCPDSKARDALLKDTDANGVMTRPVWQLMHRLPMYKDCLRGDLKVSESIEKHLVNLPSTPATQLAGSHD